MTTLSIDTHGPHIRTDICERIGCEYICDTCGAHVAPNTPHHDGIDAERGDEQDEADIARGEIERELDRCGTDY